MTTPRMGAPELPTGQNASPETMNEALRYVEQGASLFIVKDKDLTTPPGSPAEGDCYIVASTGAGAWTGWTGRITFRLSSIWEDITPIEGTTAYVQDENLVYRYSGAAWVAVPAEGITGEAAAADMWTGTSQVKFVSPKAAHDSQVPTALTSGTTITPDFNAGANFTLTLAHNATLANPSNLQAGDSGAIEITQDSGAPWTLAYGSQWKFPGGAPVLSTAAGAIDLITYWAPTTGRILCTLTKAYSS